MDTSNITFADLGLSDAMLKALEKKGYGWPTTIQAEAIPHFMQWKDVIAKAQIVHRSHLLKILRNIFSKRFRFAVLISPIGRGTAISAYRTLVR